MSLQSPTAPERLTVRDLVASRYPYQSWVQQCSSEDELEVAKA